MNAMGEVGGLVTAVVLIFLSGLLFGLTVCSMGKPPVVAEGGASCGVTFAQCWAERAGQ